MVPYSYIFHGASWIIIFSYFLYCTRVAIWSWGFSVLPFSDAPKYVLFFIIWYPHDIPNMAGKYHIISPFCWLQLSRQIGSNYPSYPVISHCIYIYNYIYICIPKKLLNGISKYISTIELDVPLTKWVVPSISPWNSHGIPMFLHGDNPQKKSTARSSSAAVNTSSMPFDLCRGGYFFGAILSVRYGENPL